MGTSIGNVASDELFVCHLGVVPYLEGLAIQERIHARRLTGELPDTLLLLEHPPTYTRARRSGGADLPLGEDFYRERGIEVHATDRGGRSTYHGPGQLVGYAIMRVDDVHGFLRTMEDAIMTALAEQGISARSRHSEGIDYTGVWVSDRKIASIGLHVSHGVSTHGFAVNVENDLEPFSWMIACGLPEVSMTSIANELPADRAVGLACFRKEVAYRFCQAHGMRQRLVTPRRLGIGTARVAGLASTRAPIKTSSLRPEPDQPAVAPAEAVPA
jgi:lipoyl(octanoyl) transferase